MDKFSYYHFKAYNTLSKGVFTVTIKELLTQITLQKIIFLAGKNGQTRNVKTVQTIETTRVNKYHQAQMLYLLDSSELLKNNDKMQALIMQLTQCEAAGIVVMENQQSMIKPNLKRLADQVKLPILQIPTLISISDGMQLFFEAMLTQQTSQLRSIIKSNQQLADLVLKHPKVDQVLDEGQKLLQTPVLLINSHFQVAYASKGLREQKDNLTTFFRNTTIDYFQLENQIKIEWEHNTFTLFPLFPAFKENKAFVAVLNYQATDEFKIVLEQLILNTLSFVNSRIDVLNESNFRNQSGFFLNILEGGMSVKLSNKRLLEMQLDPTVQYTCVMTNVITRRPVKLINYQVLEQVQQLAMWFINEYELPIQIFSWRQQLVFLVKQTVNTQHFAVAVQAFIAEKIPMDYQFLVGYSNEQAEISSLASIFKEALEALRSVEQDPELKVHKYQPKYVQELISLIPNDEVVAFRQKILKPLLTFTNQGERQVLIETLQNYFYYHQQIAQVARIMYVHRNTIIYRLKKIETLLQIDLNDPQATQNVQFALLLLANQ
ncbi:purine transport regulator [Paucilactobacillus hokkaidonensis]|uniref:Purine transport regulator n=2 Tax=Paucilactobacillus hokkaidonensis TaxID=1193095 RepID=A0ABR5Q8G5_9LACO|nr:purine transport regulator [Paucilactobacillus hokkaidonensis]